MALRTVISKRGKARPSQKIRAQSPPSPKSELRARVRSNVVAVVQLEMSKKYIRDFKLRSGSSYAISLKIHGTPQHSNFFGIIQRITFVEDRQYVFSMAQLALFVNRMLVQCCTRYHVCLLLCRCFVNI